MDHVSKFGYKGGANCLCIFPKTVYLRKAVLLDDFTIQKVQPWWAISFCFGCSCLHNKFAYVNFYCCVPFFCQAAGDLYEALLQPVIKQNSPLYII